VPLDVDRHSPAQEPGVPAGVDPLLLAALWTLPPRARAAVVLRFLEDLSETETASALGCSVGTVKSLTSRGVSRLREALADGPGEPGGSGGTVVQVSSADPRVRGGRPA
jgi:DNA-directed RNA polymerase specialized sigma24 family protein